jgi:hypothetical protein
MRNYLASFGLLLLQAAPTPTPLPPSSGSGGFGSFLWLMLGIGIGIIIGLLISKAFGRPQGKAEEKQSATPGADTPPRVASKVMPRAKRCPVCNSTYTDEALIYCVSDGASLVSVKGSPAEDSGATLPNREPPPTEAYRPHKSIK